MRAADRNGAHVGAGTRDLSGWTRRHVLAMVGEIYEVENIGLYGPGAWIRKSGRTRRRAASHEIAIELEPREMEVVSDQCV